MEQSRTVDDFLKAERKGRDCVYRLGITCTQSDSLPSRGSVVKWTISSRVTTMLPLPNKTTRSDVSSCMLPSCSPTFCPSTAVEISRYNLLRHSHQQNSPVAASFHSVSFYLVPTKRKMRTCVKLLLVLNSYFGQSYFVSHRTAVFLVRSTRTERKRKVDEGIVDSSKFLKSSRFPWFERMEISSWIDQVACTCTWVVSALLSLCKQGARDRWMTVYKRASNGCEGESA